MEWCRVMMSCCEVGTEACFSHRGDPQKLWNTLLFIMPLEDYYCGDTAFSELAMCYDTEWEQCDIKDEFLEAFGNREIAKIVYGTLIQDAIEWIDRTIPALEGLTPRECLNTPNGLIHVKECLMWMPW